MSIRLYVGNLSYDTTDESLFAGFAAFGPVERALVLKDSITQRSRGFGFVWMVRLNDAKRAINKLDGASFEGRPIKVNLAKEEANPLPEGLRELKESSALFTGPDEPCITVWVDPGEASEDEIRELFAALSEMNRSFGGPGLMFAKDSSQTPLVMAVAR